MEPSASLQLIASHCLALKATDEGTGYLVLRIWRNGRHGSATAQLFYHISHYLFKFSIRSFSFCQSQVLHPFMADRAVVLLFGDVTCDYDAGLQALAARKDSPILIDFFSRVAFALRSEIGNLPISDRQNSGLVNFTSFVELLARLRKAKTRHHALETALTCVHQFASFIGCVR